MQVRETEVLVNVVGSKRCVQLSALPPLCLACCNLFPIQPPRLFSLCMELPLLVPCSEFHCCLGPVITENNNHNLGNQNFKHKLISRDVLVSFLLSLCVQLPQ